MKDDDQRSEAQAKAQLESIREMVAALERATAKGNDGEIDDARQQVHEDPLSVEVRSDWYCPGDLDADSKPAEYRILLCTGGPAVQLVGRLSIHGEPESAELQHQDWGLPWTRLPVSSEDEDALISYAREFCFEG